uniref:Uncharacterized protein n=1 Tax=Arundo donax TaxID=35708 RepID=A0A0A9GTY9_ARUDO
MLRRSCHCEHISTTISGFQLFWVSKALESTVDKDAESVTKYLCLLH